MPDEHVKNVSGCSFTCYITFVFVLNFIEMCHYGENYVLKLLNNEDDDGM